MSRPISRLINFAVECAALVLVALSATFAPGQAISGDLVGTVVDSSGAAITDANVAAGNTATGVSWSTKTNGEGHYRFTNLPPGTYKITVESKGFKTFTQRTDIQLNKTGTVDITMVPGAENETVQVEAVPPTIDTTTNQVQTTYEEKMTQDLPAASVGLGVLNLSLLQAGVGSTGGTGSGAGPSVGGLRPNQNSFTIEGVDNNEKVATGPLVYVPNDAVANFTLLQNQYSPEFGHSAAAQFNTIVLSGTNAYHGRVYEYFRNRNLDAVDQSLANQGIFTNPRYDNNRFGGQIGGPVLKNKLFFFVNYEYNPIGQAATPGAPILAPTAAGYAAALAVTGVSANNLNVLKQYATAPSACTAAQVSAGICPGATSTTPAGTVPLTGLPSGTGVEVGVLPVVAPNYSNQQALVTSMDYNFSTRDQIRGRYIYNKLSNIDIGAQLPVFFLPLSTPYHLVSLAEYHTFSPSLLNEFRFGFNRYASVTSVPNIQFPGLDSFPNITLDSLGGLNLGPDPGAPGATTENLYQGVDNLTWVHGNHTAKFGLEGRLAISPQIFIQRSRGDYEYATFNSYAYDQIPDGPIAERGFSSFGYEGGLHAIYWYANDVWKVRPSLTLNLGLRYEYTSTPKSWDQQTLNSISSVPGLIVFNKPEAPKTDFAPRVGFAYSPGTSGRTSVRGGFGIGYDVLFDNVGASGRPPQIGFNVDCPTTCKTPFLANGGIPPQPSSGITILPQDEARAKTSGYYPKVKYPYSETWNLGVQHVFASVYTAEVRYVGTRGLALIVQNRLNIQDVVTPTNSLPTYLQAPSQTTLDALTLTLGQLQTDYNNGGYYVPDYKNAGFNGSAVTAYEPWGASTYHGLQSQLTRRFHNGFQLQAAYTYSHTIDNSTAEFHTTDISPRRAQDFENYHVERANSALDHAHRLTIATIYDLPFLRQHSSWLMRNVVGNWELAPIYTWESGQWGGVQSGIDSNLNGDGCCDRGILNRTGLPRTGSGVLNLCNSSLPSGHLCNNDPDPNFDPSPYVVAYQAANPQAQYIVAGIGALATSSRNNFSTPPINNFDLTVAKHIAATERIRIDLLAQFLNALNHPQFVTGQLNQVNIIQGVGSVRNYFIPSSPNFGIARATFPSNARITQLGLKVSF